MPYLRRPGLGAAALAALAAGGIAAPSASAAGHARAAAGKISVVYIPGLTGNPFYSTVACGAAVEAKKLGVSFSVQGAPTFAVSAQTPIVSAVTAKQPTAIMISNDDPKAMIPPLLKAQQAGIKIINIDGDLSNKKVGITNIQSNNMIGGQMAGQAMVRLTKGQAGSLLIEDNAPGYPISEQRRQGLISYMKQHDPKVKILPIVYTNNEVATAASDVRAAAAAHPDLIGVYTVETNNTQGALTGLEEAHLTGKVKLIGYDTSPPIVAGIRSGKVSADIVQYPYGEGMLGLKDAVLAAHGKKVPREQTQPFVVATKANINTAKVQQFIYKTSCKA
ncbi:MAG TPA: ABC transporter substrate-binding protein [Solirubrobacteraceae bacterium]|nr:ABC transporter substrate-binding protein [Solirubrobacteraceae bacterium]